MDIDDLDAGRLCNVAYASLVAEAGPLSNPGEVREHIDGVLKRAGAAPKGQRRGNGRSRAGITAAQARKMASDLDSYDSQIQGGRLRGGE